MKRLKPYFLIALVLLPVILWIDHNYLTRANLTWDEAGHALYAYRIYDSLVSRNWLLFLKTSLVQVQYPFLPSWLTAPWLLLVGFSLEKLRRFSLLMFILAALLLFKVGRQIGHKARNLVGLLALFFFLTSPIMILNAGFYMKEMLGAAIFLGLVTTYFEARDQKNNHKFVLTGILLLCLALTKHNYGALMIAVLGLEGLLDFVISKRRFSVITNNLLIFLPFLFGFLGWLALPGNVDNKPRFIIQVLTGPSPIRRTISSFADFWVSFTYYPLSFLTSFTFSIAIGIYLLISFIVAIFYLSDYRLRVIWLLPAVNFILGMAHFPNLQGRYFMPVIPFVFLVGAFMEVKLWEKIAVLKKRAFILGVLISWGVFLGGKVIFDLVHLPKYTYSVGAFTTASVIFNHEDSKDTSDYIVGRFNFNTNDWPRKLPRGNFEKPVDVINFITSSLDYSKPIERVVGYANEFSPGAFDLAFELAKKKRKWPSLPCDSLIITLEIFPESRFYNNGYQFHNMWQIDEIRRLEKDASLTPITRKKFEQLGVEAIVYGRNLVVK